jgi:hypothetical protein
MPVDIDVLFTNIFGDFHIHTVRTERVKDFCDFTGKDYKQIPGCANVGWQSLLPALGRKFFFMTEFVLKQFFGNSETELWLSFAHSQASIFHETIKVTAGDDKCATESALAVKVPL